MLLKNVILNAKYVLWIEIIVLNVLKVWTGVCLHQVVIVKWDIMTMEEVLNNAINVLSIVWNGKIII